MKIQIDGTTTLNKGSELMLYAVLEQIEKKHPDATVIFNDKSPGIQYHDIKTSLRFIKPPRLFLGHYPWAILSRLHLPYVRFTEFHPTKNIDLILDASGFRLGDQWDKPEAYYQNMESYYETMKSRGTSIVFLPQAFGPFESEKAKKSVEIANKYVDLIIAREHISKKYLIDAGVNPLKIRQYPDFTIATKGTFPDKYSAVKGGICIIPNKKMITHTRLEPRNYYEKFELLISRVQKSGRPIFLLNHEGKEDLEICKAINKRLDNRIPVLTGLNAKEIKGVIGSSHIVISSRYHGAASALNQGIPCIATSWSHKYQLLFEDFKVNDHIIAPEEDPGQTEKKINFLLQPDNHAKMQTHLQKKAFEIKNITENMWDEVWNKIVL